MKTFNRYLMLLALALAGTLASWAQDEVTVSATANDNEWTFEMPDADVELEVDYYTDEEWLDMGESLELTKTAEGEWTLAAMPAFDVELEIEYYNELTDDADNSTLLESLDGQTTDIYVNRTLAPEKWYSLCLPFAVDLTADGPLKGVTAKTLGSVTNDGTTLTVTFGEAVTTMEAGKPYIVRLPEDATLDIVNPLFEGATISKTLTDVVVSGATFKGTYAPVTLTAPDTKKLFLQSNKLYYPGTSDATINAFRAYIELDKDVPTGSGAPNIVLNFDGETTGVIELKDSRIEELKSDGEWYTLDGREISGKPAQKGVYIHNGRKEVVR